MRLSFSLTIVNNNLLGILSFVRQHIITLCLAGISLVVHGLLVVRGVDFGGDFFELQLLKTGALFNPYVLQDQPWRIFSSMFMHGGLWHLGMNMLVFLLVGPRLERRLGPWKYLAAYLFCGTMAALALLWLNWFAIGVGASGAIFGLFGIELVVLLAEKMNQRAEVLRILASFGVMLVLNIGFG